MSKLPQPKLFTLGEARTFVAQQTGGAEDEAGTVIRRALMEGAFKAQGRPIGRNRQRRSSRIIKRPEYWGPELEAINWKTSEALTRPRGRDSVELGFAEVTIDRSDLVYWLSMNTAPTDTGADSTVSSPSGKRGRTPKYDWDAFWVEVAVRGDLDNLPETQGELIRDMAQWCENEWGEQPGASTLKAKLGPIYNHPRKLSGGDGQ